MVSNPVTYCSKITRSAAGLRRARSTRNRARARMLIVVSESATRRTAMPGSPHGLTCTIAFARFRAARFKMLQSLRFFSLAALTGLAGVAVTGCWSRGVEHDAAKSETRLDIAKD